MNLLVQRKNIQNWIAQNYGSILLNLLSGLILFFSKDWLPFPVAFLIWTILLANVFFIFSLIQKRFEKNKQSKFKIWLEINVIAIFLSFAFISIAFLFVYGVGSIPDNILPILWSGAFFTVSSILLFRLYKLFRNRNIL